MYSYHKRIDEQCGDEFVFNFVVEVGAGQSRDHESLPHSETCSSSQNLISTSISVLATASPRVHSPQETLPSMFQPSLAILLHFAIVGRVSPVVNHGSFSLRWIDYKRNENRCPS